MAINANDYEFRIWFDPDAVDDGGRFMAQVVEWPHLKADGHTPAQAAQLLREVLEGCLEIAQEKGRPVPQPLRTQAAGVSQAAAALGRLGGKSKSPAKVAAVRRNGRLGGRPKKARELVAA